MHAGARFSSVIEEIDVSSGDLSGEDHVLVIAGTNNVEHMSITRFLKEIKELVATFNKANLVLATLPMRYDEPRLDFKIARINRELE